MAHVLAWCQVHDLHGSLQLAELRYQGPPKPPASQMGWIIVPYQFHIQFRPGKANGKADALTGRSGDLPYEGDGRGRPEQALLPPDKFLDFPDFPDKPEPENSISSTKFINSAILCNTAIKHNPDIRAAFVKDELANTIMNAPRDGCKQLSGKHARSVSLGEGSLDPHTGLLYVYGLLYVPNDASENLHREIIHTHHDHPTAGHPGRAATYELVSCNYWWPGMRETIARYLANYDTCARIKPVRHAPYGLLKPLQVPVVRWSSVSMDFITGLPESKPPDS